MSFTADKKRGHEADAERAIAANDFAKALFHTTEAAKLGFCLAEQAEGKIAERYVEDANALIDVAAKLKQRVVEATKDGDLASKAKEPISAGDKGEKGEGQWELKERPTQRLADVAGMDEVKTELREKVIEPFLDPDLYERFKVEIGGGILMYGPPGNGKTYIAKAIAGELDAAFFNVSASQIKDKYVGESEKNLQRLFDEARQHERAVIFLDEVDALLARKGNQKIGTVTQFLALTDGLVQNTNCLLVLGATNKPWMLDAAVVRPGRLGTHIYVGPPDVDAREAILAINLSEVPTDPELDLGSLAVKTDRYSGADVAALCSRAKVLALGRQKASGEEEVVTLEDFEEALRRVKPSVSPEQVAEYLAWKGQASDEDDD